MRTPILSWLDTIKRGILIIVLLFSLVACSGSPPTVQAPLSDSSITTKTARATAPGSVTLLLPPTQIAVTTQPLTDDNQWITWSDPDLGYVAAAPAGNEVVIPGLPTTADLTVTALSPLGQPLPSQCQSPSPSPSPSPTPTPTPQCCRVCTTGKACGNSCININYQCHRPPGCACNALS